MGSKITYIIWLGSALLFSSADTFAKNREMLKVKKNLVFKDERAAMGPATMPPPPPMRLPPPAPPCVKDQDVAEDEKYIPLPEPVLPIKHVELDANLWKHFLAMSLIIVNIFIALFILKCT